MKRLGIEYIDAMSDNPAKPARIKRLARSLCEWAMMAFGTLSIVCLAYWTVSIYTRRADPPPLALRLGTVSATNGTLEICSYLDQDISVLEGIASLPANNMGIVADRAIDLPGFRLRMLTYYNGYSDWAIEVSILIVAAVSAVLTVLCLAMYRYLRRRAAQKPPVT